jgi:ABC-type antimicrobial peptide transport system permease subunit
MVVVARTERPAAALRSIEQALHSVDPSVPVFGLATMRDVIVDSLSSTRLLVYLLGCFAGLALILGAVGVYGVMSWMVTRRTREIGIRMALGASAREVRRSVVSSAMRTVGLGLALGVTAAYLGLRVIASLLYEVEPGDLPTYLVVVATIALVGLAAGWVPAHRASRVEPLRALRTE